MVNSRNKGAAGERAVAKLLFDELGIEFRRDLEQYRSADRGDLLCDVPNWPFVLEVKTYASGTGLKPEWWRQACAAAQMAGLQPVVIYKYNNRPWRVAMTLSTVFDGASDEVIEMSIPTFCLIAREMIN